MQYPVAEGLYIAGWQIAPQLACQCCLFYYFCGKGTASGFMGYLGQEGFVHDHLFAVGVQMSFGQLYGLAQHQAQ